MSRCQFRPIPEPNQTHGNATFTDNGSPTPSSSKLTLTYSYDAADNRTLVQDSLGGVTTSTYDAADRLTQRAFGGSGQTPLRMDVTWTDRDQLASLTRYRDLAGTQKVGSTLLVRPRRHRPADRGERWAQRELRLRRHRQPQHRS